MRIRNQLSVIGMLGALAGMAVVPAGAQDSAAALDQQVRMRMLIEQITRNRPPQAEQAARELMQRLQLAQATLDSLRAHSIDQYWQEVAQLTVQREQLSHAPDSLRAQMLAQMIASEARARGLQRTYREVLDSARTHSRVAVDSARVSELRARLQAQMDRHFAAEDSLRSLEVADVERRLSQVRAETERRRRERAELVRQMVDQILRDAERP
jgi:hypothetical protein